MSGERRYTHPDMIDITFLSLCIATLCALVLVVWRRFRGSSESRGRAVMRLAVSTFAAALIVVSIAWQVSKSRGFQLIGRPIVGVNTERKVVALTLDDGPSPEYTAEILSILRQHGARATFFVTGGELAHHADHGRAIVRDGHELGNHSYSHTRMIGSSLSFIEAEIESTDRLIRTAGHTGPIHFRPPYGKKLLALPYYLSKTNRTSILWDIEPESHPEVAASPEKITAYVLERVRPGSIILLHVMHHSRETSRRALPGLLASLQARDYEVVSLSELMSASDPM
jgi:peptidoglycan/xylan/chitin deacetylase (PgdA/CDA1 family)